MTDVHIYRYITNENICNLPESYIEYNFLEVVNILISSTPKDIEKAKNEFILFVQENKILNENHKEILLNFISQEKTELEFLRIILLNNGMRDKLNKIYLSSNYVVLYQIRFIFYEINCLIAAERESNFVNNNDSKSLYLYVKVERDKEFPTCIILPGFSCLTTSKLDATNEIQGYQNIIIKIHFSKEIFKKLLYFHEDQIYISTFILLVRITREDNHYYGEILNLNDLEHLLLPPTISYANHIRSILQHDNELEIFTLSELLEEKKLSFKLLELLLKNKNEIFLKSEASEVVLSFLIGCAYFNKGEYFSALIHLNEALLKSKLNPGKLKIMLKLIKTLEECGDTSKAKVYLKEGYSLCKELFQEEENLEYLNFCSLEAEILILEKEFTQAEVILERIIVKKKYILGDIHQDLIGNLNSLALLYFRYFQYDKSLILSEELYNIRRHTTGLNHPNTGNSLNNFGLLYFNKGEEKKAVEYFNQAIEVFKKVLGKDHLELSRCFYNLGIVYSRWGKYTEAISTLKQSLKIRNASNGKYYFKTSIVSNRLAMIHLEIQKYEKAAYFLTTTLKIVEGTSGSKDEKSRNVRYHINLMLPKLKD
jgi:tetratricopeptide (TPR) repeat protein